MSLMDILYWRDVKVTGAIFVGCILLLTSFHHFSVVTVITYLLMLALVPPLIYRLVVSAKAAVLKTQCEHPFREWLDCDIESFIGEKDKNVLPKVLKHILNECRRILLVEDTVDTIKVLFIVYIVSYLGELFSGITLLYLAVIFTFTVPKVYDLYKVAHQDLKSAILDCYNYACKFHAKNYKPIFYKTDINNLIGKVNTLVNDLKKRVFSSTPSKSKSFTKKPSATKSDKKIEDIPKKEAIEEDADEAKEKIS